MEKIKRVACYCRVSTDEQKKHGYSIQAQKERLGTLHLFSPDGIPPGYSFTKEKG